MAPDPSNVLMTCPRCGIQTSTMINNLCWTCHKTPKKKKPTYDRWHPWREDRKFRIRVTIFAGPWFSFGVHVDAGPSVDIHIGWWHITIGRMRNCEISGWQFPKNPRAE